MKAAVTSLQMLPSNLTHRLTAAAVTRISLKEMFMKNREILANHDGTALVTPAQFLHRELPVRLGQSVALLDATLSHSDTTHSRSSILRATVVKRVIHQYVNDIKLLLDTPVPKTAEQAIGFTSILHKIREGQRQSIFTLGEGVSPLASLEHTEETRQMQRFLGRFFSAHLGTHMLIGNHLTLCEHGRTLVDTVRPYDIAQQAIEDARRSCAVVYGRPAPNVEFIAPEPSVSTTYIPEHLRRILYETVTFALRGTMEHFGVAKDATSTSSTVPSVKVVMINGEEDVSFKVSDIAGGTPARQVERLWWYNWEDVIRAHSRNAGLTPVADQSSEFQSVCPFAMPTNGEPANLTCMPGFGFGRGLPVARLAARYFGGDLDLVSMEGYGTDVYVHLTRADTCLENFPPSPEVADAIDRNYWIIPPAAVELEA
ncbi:hypothetical protein BDF19DRAFT_440101 [Syncephalis fuscata]|nr:hypothetical protein BDF19DRAFT_440101 [Syncephalis fuscata]